MTTELVLALAPQTLELATDPPSTLAFFEQKPVLVSTAEQGPSGPQGIQGPPGVPGPAGGIDPDVIIDGGNW